MQKYALFGTGRQSSRLLKASIANKLKIVSLYSRNKEKGKDFLKNTDYRFSYISNILEEVINHKEVEGVIIATPDFMHYEHIKKVLEYKKHIYVEKPLTTNVELAKELIALTKKMDASLYVSYHLRQLNTLQYIKYLLNEHMGSIYKLCIEWGYIPSNTNDWRTKENPWWCSSILGTHCLDLALWLLKPICGNVITFSGFASNQYYKKLDDTLEMNLSFQNNTTAEIRCSLGFDAPLSISIESSMGKFLYENILSQCINITFHNKHKKIYNADPFTKTISEFVRSIDKRVRVNTSLDECLENLSFLSSIKIPKAAI